MSIILPIADTNILQGFSLCQADNNTYHIQCYFLKESSATGCAYSLQVDDGKGLVSYDGKIDSFEEYPEVVRTSAFITFLGILIRNLDEDSISIPDSQKMFLGPVTQCTESKHVILTSPDQT